MDDIKPTPSNRTNSEPAEETSQSAPSPSQVITPQTKVADQSLASSQIMGSSIDAPEVPNNLPDNDSEASNIVQDDSFNQVNDTARLFEKDSTPAPIVGKTKNNKLPFMILLVVVIVLALSTAAYFAFMSSDTSDSSNSTVNSSNSETDNKEDVIDPNGVSDSIDSSLESINDDSDYNANDLSDTTLGL